MAISMAAKNTKSYIHVAIMLALMLGIGYLPPFAQVTPLGMKVLGVFLGLVYGGVLSIFYGPVSWDSLL